MNAKKAIKKITAIGAGALLVGSSLLGASAANLNEYPQPFVTEDGQGDVQFVIGSGSTDDYLGALDIAVALQASAVETDTVEIDGETTTTVEGGYKFEEKTQTLILGEGLDDVQSTIDDGDLPNLLVSGVVSDTDNENEDYKYDQEIVLNDGIDVTFGRPDNNDFDDPVDYLDSDSGKYVDFVVDFSDNLKVTHDSSDAGSGLNNGESIEMFGETFTFDATIGHGDDLVLYGSDTTSFLELNEPVTVESDGSSYTIEIVGANSDASGGETVILDVNGERKTVTEGDSTTIDGLDVYVKDTFVTNIPTLSASANIFVGSEEVTIGTSAIDTAGACGDFSSFDINGDSADGMEVCVLETDADGTTWNAIEEIIFRWEPADMEPEVEWLVEGEEVVPPMFESVKLQYEGPSIPYDSESRNTIDWEVSGNEIVLTFTNEDGNEYSLPLLEIMGDNDIELADDVGAKDYSATEFQIGADTNIVEDTIFIANEGLSAGVADEGTVTRIFQVVDIDEDDNEVTFEDLSTGTEYVVSEEKDLEDTGLTVKLDSVTADDFEFLESTENKIYTENDWEIDLSGVVEDVAGASGNTTEADNITMTEDFDSQIIDDASGNAVATFDISRDSDDLDLANLAITKSQSESDDDSDYKYFVTEIGTYVVEETDGETDQITFYAADEEVSYNAFIAPTSSEVVVSGGADGVTTENVNPFAVGIAVRDVDVNLANPASNLIVVGGTCINSVAAELKDVAANTCGTESGLNPNEAIVELFELDNGKVAMLVAGWEATETQAAARAVATEEIADVDGSSATLTVSSASNFDIQ